MKNNYFILNKKFDFKSILVLILFLYSTSEIYSQVIVNFPSSSTWTCPSNVTSIQVTAYGGGGGGGRGGSANRNGGGGGGGGAYTENLTVPVTPGVTYTITIGAPGSGGTTGTPNGGNGGQTTATFDSSTTITANGGFGGLAYVNAATGGAGGAGGTRNGGTGGTGATNGSGGGGGCAGTTSNGGAGGAGGTTTGGTAGGGSAGTGGAGIITNGNPGNAGINYGGGGSGGTNASNGGAGAGGFMTITYTASNDICSNAIALTVNPSLACTASTTGSTIGASDNNETGDCINGTEKAVWYRFIATYTSHIITVDGIAGFNAVIGAVTTCGSTTIPTGGACTDLTGDDGIETFTLPGLI